eukprot:3233379-Lingulodinium_polyedra.AAC.1
MSNRLEELKDNETLAGSESLQEVVKFYEEHEELGCLGQRVQDLQGALCLEGDSARGAAEGHPEPQARLHLHVVRLRGAAWMHM